MATPDHPKPARIRLTRHAFCDRLYPIEIRKLIYTTNGIESLNARFRQAARRRGHFPTEQAALKILYLTVRERRPNRANPTGQVPGWKAILNLLAMAYGDRLDIN